jgi:hypothetical protein
MKQARSFSSGDPMAESVLNERLVGLRAALLIARQIADKFPEEVGPALIEVNICEEIREIVTGSWSPTFDDKRVQHWLRHE